MLRRSVIYPRRLYDTLPYLYIAMGALTAAALENPLKYIPAAVFVLTGVLVILWRLGRDKRSESRHHRPSAERRHGPHERRYPPQHGSH